MKDIDTYCNLLKAELAPHKVDLLDHATNNGAIYLRLCFKEKGLDDWYVDRDFLNAVKRKPRNVDVYSYLMNL